MQALAELHPGSFAPQHVVAFSAEGPRRWSELLADVSALRSEFANRNVADVALFHSDAYWFTAALLALLAERRRVFLPGDNHPGVIASLRQRGLQLTGEFLDEDSLPIGPDAQCPLPDGASPIIQHDTALHLAGEIVVFTSGSTGEPKALPKSLRQLDAEVATLEAAFGAELGGCAVLGTVSHQHFYGLLFRVLWPLCAGRAFWRRAFVDNAALARRSLEFERVCWVSGPGHLHRLGADLPWTALRSSVAAVFSSGGPLNPEAARQVQEGLTIAPREIFGSSETGAVACRQLAGDLPPWRALPGVEVGLSERGALQVRSPYLECEGWFATEDSAEIHSDGRFTLGSRLDRIAKLEGKRIALPEVEAALLATPWVKEAHCLVLPGRSTRIAALITLTPEGEARLGQGHLAAFYRALRERLATTLVPLALPRRWRILPFLPRDAQGKLRLARIVPLFASRRIPPVLGADIGAGKVELRVWVDRTCPYFEGHFPQGKVLPGVAQVFWAQALAEDYFPLAGEFAGMRQLKFKEIIGADTVVTLVLEYDAERRQLQFHFRSASGEHSQGRLQYREE